MANRYTNLTPSAYTPMTFEEIAVVPAMKRKQHDTLISKYEDIKSGLAKTDPHSKHFDEALRLKQDIERKMDTMATQLSEQGVNQDMIGKTISMNREYQDLMSPTGKLGQINAEKINIAKINEDYDKMAAAQKWSPAESDYWKNKALSEYTDVNKNPIYDPETGRLNTYKGPVAAPTRINYADKFHSYATNAKMSTSEFARAAQELATDEATGQSAVKGSSYSSKWGKNTPAVLAAYETMKREMQDPTSDVYKSMMYEQRQPANLLDTINRQKDIYKQTISAVERGSTINPYGDGKDNTLSGEGDIVTTDSTLTPETAGHNTYTGGLEEFKALEAKKNRNPQEQSRLNDLRDLRQEADRKLNDSDDYNRVLESAVKKLNRIEDFKKRNFEKGPGDKLVRKKGADTYSEIHLNKMENEYKDILKQKQKLKDDAWNKSSAIRHSYSYIPKTSKEETEFGIHNENIYNIMKGMPNLGNALDLTSIETPGGTRKDLDDKDVQNVHELLKTADPKTFKISNIKTFGSDRTPEVTMTFNAGENASEYGGKILDWDAAYGGGEAPVSVTFKMKRFSNAYDTGSAPGYKSLSGAMADFWKNKGKVNQITGNFQGSEVSNSLISNRYADIPTKELEKRAVVDEDAREALMIRTAKHQAKKRK